MTLICAHRVNDPAQLNRLPDKYGVEIDLRSDGVGLILEHDALTPGPAFEEWLQNYHHSFIVLNVKEEGLEHLISEMLEKRGISQWAFLDQSFPFMVRSLRAGETRTMARLSEFERPETILALPWRPDWIWVDSFTGAWPSSDTLASLAIDGRKFMVVSPELQGRHLDDEQELICSRFVDAGLQLDGVCTKSPQSWDQEGSAWWHA